MALINTMRNKMGTFLVVVIFVAILSFVLGDLFSNNRGGNFDQTIGEIAGATINRDTYQNEIEQLKYNYQLNFGRNPSEAEMTNIRNQAWELMIAKVAYQQEYDNLGLKVTTSEIIDMVQGKNIQPEIRQAFTNPETGEFSKGQIVEFLRNFEALPPQQQASWNNFESNLLPSRTRLKYENLIINSEYATKAEAKMEYKQQSDIAEVKYVYVPNYAINDSLVEVTDAELTTYINDHEDEYQVEEARSLKYVSFPIIPSPEDTLYFENEMEEIKKEFESISDDSVFARVNTDGTNPFAMYNKGNMPLRLAPIIDDLQKGMIIGPELEGNALKLYKISDVFEDTTFSAKASHILIRAAGTDEEKAEAKKEAQRILNLIKGGADFAEMAAEYGTDGTAQKGGDLGWFSTGRMVEPFQDAVFAATKKGLIPSLVETQFGYHIIDVTELKTNVSYKVASIERTIIAGKQTIDEVYRRSEIFASKVNNLAELEDNAKKDSLSVIEASDLGTNATRVGVLDKSRSIVQWLYNTASEGVVSDVFELENEYVLAVMTDETEKGTAKLKDVRNEILAKVKNQKKSALIIEKLQDLSGSLDEIATAYGSDANVYSSSDLKLSSNSLPNVGVAPEAVGKAFSLTAGTRSEPFAVDNGVLLMELTNLTPATEIADYTIYKDQVAQRLKTNSTNGISQAIKEFADIEDTRYKFY